MYKAILFDFYGVFCADISHEWFKDHAIDYDKQINDFRDLCTRSDYGQINADQFCEELTLMTNSKVKVTPSDIGTYEAFNESLVTLVRKLKNNYKIACLSNCTDDWINIVMERHKIKDLFDEIIISGNIGIVKPYPEFYEYALNKLNISPEEAIFTDDRQSNVDGAKYCGIESILFSNTDSLESQLMKLGVTF